MEFYFPRWMRTGKSVDANGETIMQYATIDGTCKIHSRKTEVQRVRRSGTWMRTTFVLSAYGTDQEFDSLHEAKAAVRNTCVNCKHGKFNVASICEKGMFVSNPRGSQCDAWEWKWKKSAGMNKEEQNEKSYLER